MATVSTDGVVTGMPITTVPGSVTIHLPDERPTIVIPHFAATLDGFREWAMTDNFPERGKITFVAGEVIVDMSPESLEEHSEIKSEVVRVLLNLVREQRLGRIHVDGVLVSNKQAGVSNEPDALLVSKATLLSGKAQLIPARGRPRSNKEIVGTVDWIVEIVSPSSKRKDKILLRKAYFEAGVGEYWLIDALGEEIDFQMLIPGSTEYVPVTPQDGWLASPTFGKLFKLERSFDEDGFLEYTLHMK